MPRKTGFRLTENSPEVMRRGPIGFGYAYPPVRSYLCLSSAEVGFTTVFVILGASATALGQLLLNYRYELNVVGGGVVVAFGLFLIGAIRPFWLQRDLRFNIVLPGGRPVAAYVLGLAFAFGWTPCIGPILGAILTVSAGTATVGQGVALLAIYSFGLGAIPIRIITTPAIICRVRPVRRIAERRDASPCVNSAATRNGTQ